MSGPAGLPHPPLLVITDRHQAERPLEVLAREIFAAGCRWLLLREKDLAADELRGLTESLAALARAHGARLSVSADLAAAEMADGVHLPHAGDIAQARARLGPEALIGRSAHDLAEVQAAAEAGADYVTLSPIFPTASKPGYGPALGLEGLRAISARASVPVLALGGVEPGNARDCLAAGAAGLAVMGTVMRTPDPGPLVTDLIATAEGYWSGAVDHGNMGAPG